jgi:hypothetical protein
MRGVTFTNALKKDMVDNAVAMIETGRAQILNPKASVEARIQFDELTEFREIVLPTSVRYEGPVGGHDDTVTSVIGALWACQDTRPSALGALHRATGGVW